MTNYKYLRGASISDPSRVIFDIPDTPTIGTATDVGTARSYNNGAATVTITGNAVTGGPTTGYTVTSSPGAFTGSGTSPVTVTGLQSATSYTFTAQATNSSGNSVATSATTSAITATTVPQAPTIGTFTDDGTGTGGTLSFTAGATGGKSITGYKVSTDGSTYTTVSATTSPLSLSGLTPGTYNFTLKATNANGDSAASGSVSGTVVFPSNFVSIATQTVGSGGASSITFSSIPSTYTHLQIRVSATYSAGTEQDSTITFNGDTGTNYSYTVLDGSGTSATGNRQTNTTNIQFAGWSYNLNSTTNPSTMIANIMNYSNPTTYKTALVRSMALGTPGNCVDAFVGTWRNTAVITSITINGSVVSGTTFSLYGIASA